MEEDQTLRFSLRMPKDLHERLSASANDNNLSLNAEMLRLLALGLDKEVSKEPDKTLVEQLLPPATIWRIGRFKEASGLPSDEEAVKRLVKIALDDRESAKDILDKLQNSFESEKDLRILARDVIAAHAAIDSLIYGTGNEYVWFKTKTNESGAIDRKGNLYYSGDGSSWDYHMNSYSPPKKTAARAVSGWDARPGKNLDDEIPF